MPAYNYIEFNPNIPTVITGDKIIALQQSGKDKIRPGYANFLASKSAAPAAPASPALEEVESLDLNAPANVTPVINGADFQQPPAELDPKTPLETAMVEPFNVDTAAPVQTPVTQPPVDAVPSVPAEAPVVSAPSNNQKISAVEFVSQVDKLVDMADFDEASKNLIRNHIRGDVATASIVNDLNTLKLEIFDVSKQVQTVRSNIAPAPSQAPQANAQEGPTLNYSQAA